MKKISRRKFLFYTSGTLLMLLLGGCKKEESENASESMAGISNQSSDGGSGSVSTINPEENIENAQQLEQATATVSATEPSENSMTEKETVRSKCPKGLINDPYPGHCHLYVDNNGNGICDYSEV